MLYVVVVFNSLEIMRNNKWFHISLVVYIWSWSHNDIVFLKKKITNNNSKFTWKILNKTKHHIDYFPPIFIFVHIYFFRTLFSKLDLPNRNETRNIVDVLFDKSVIELILLVFEFWWKFPIEYLWEEISLGWISVLEW